MDIGGVSLNGVAIPELGVAPLADSDTALEDELPTPEVSPIFHDSSLEGVRPPGGCSAPQGLVDLELEKALLCVSVLPAMLSPIEEPVVSVPVAPSTYPEPPIPVSLSDGLGAMSNVSPLQVAADIPLLDVFPLYSPSPACSAYEPVTSPVTTSPHEEDGYRSPPVRPRWDQYLSRDGDLLLGDAVDLPLLPLPPTPRPAVVDLVLESSVDSPAGVPVTPSSVGMLYVS